MSDIKLFKVAAGRATELQGDPSDLERPLQTLIENNLEPLLGIRFVKSEHSTGKTHGGRIDSLGLDENNCPVILEYKRSVSENVISQGLYYLDWLMDHKAEFQLLIMSKLGSQVAEQIDWSGPRLVCIAGDFTKYDAYAVQQIDRSIELIRYKLFADELLLLELVNATSGSSGSARSSGTKIAVGKDLPELGSEGRSTPIRGTDKTYAEWSETLPGDIKTLLISMEDYIQSLGDDVQRKELKLYSAFKRLKNFATIVPNKSKLLLYLHIDPDRLGSLPAFGRDMRQIGHWGTGDVELAISSQLDFETVKPLIMMAYEGRAIVA